MNKNKRGLLKGLALGSAWSAPVVTAITLPPHAQSTPCEVAAGCYVYDCSLVSSNESGDCSFFWLGVGQVGKDSQDNLIFGYDTATCSGSQAGSHVYVLARTREEAEVLINTQIKYVPPDTPFFTGPFELDVDTGTPCHFWSIQVG